MDLLTIGIVLKAFDQSSQVLRQVSGSLETFQNKLISTSESIKKVGMSSLSSGLIAAGVMQKPINAFMDLEDAATQLKSTLMESTGEIPKIFDAIDKEAMQLGDMLPGTTKDFYQMASAMKALGVSGEAIAGGALRSAAYLGVVLKPLGVSYEQAAIGVAKFKEALGVNEKDLLPFMDLIQKTAHTGVKMEEMKYAFSKLAGPLKALGLQGLKTANEMTPLLGMIIKTGRSGEETGTAIGNIIEASMDSKKVSKVNELLRGTGISLEFVDKQTGKFKGIENMIAQLDKLQGFADADKALLFKELLGSGGAADVGKLMSMKGYKEQITAMQKQADLNKRVELSLGTLRNAWEAFVGTFTNFLAIFGNAVAPTLKRFADMLNDLTSKFSDFAKNNQTFVRIISVASVSIAGLLVVFGALGIATSAVIKGFAGAISGFSKFVSLTGVAISWIKVKTALLWNLIYTKIYLDRIQYRGGFYQAMQYWLMTTRLRMLELIATARLWIAQQITMMRTHLLTTTGVKALAVSMATTLKTAFLSVLTVVRTLSVALLTSPIGWLAMAIGTVALIIYKYWAPIKGFFTGLMQGIKESLKGLQPAWDGLKKMAFLLMPILTPLRWIYNLVKGLLKPVDDVGKAGETLGIRWGRAIGNILKSLLLLPYKMFQAGKNMVEGLYSGIVSMANKPIEAVKGIAQKIRDLWPFSPAKTGPLKDIHNIKLVETIAETIKPAPVVSKMTKVTEAIAGQGRHITKNTTSTLQQGQPGGLTINYSPTITLNGMGANGEEKSFRLLLREHIDELVTMIEQKQYANARRAY